MCAIVCGSRLIHLIYGMKCVSIVHTHKLVRHRFKDFQDVATCVYRTSRKSLNPCCEFVIVMMEPVSCSLKLSVNVCLYAHSWREVCRHSPHSQCRFKDFQDVAIHVVHSESSCISAAQVSECGLHVIVSLCT